MHLKDPEWTCPSQGQTLYCYEIIQEVSGRVQAKAETQADLDQTREAEASIVETSVQIIRACR